MQDEQLSGEEKRQKMKEQFKKELREKKEFLEKVKGLRRVTSINKALEDMVPTDDSQDWIDKLNQETAFNDAKMEMALETANQKAADAATEAENVMDDAEIQKITAEEMVRKMKEEMAAERSMLNVEVQTDGDVTEKEIPEEDEPSDDNPRRRMIDID